MQADGDHGTRRRARARTLARLLWSAQAEGLRLDDPVADGFDGDGLSAVLVAVRTAILDSCEREGIQFSEQSWQRLMMEIENSVNNEHLALEWREKTWSPAVRKLAAPQESLWHWLGTMDAASEEAQLTWEILASFDGHMTHPCAKTKLGIADEELPRLSGEFGPRVPLIVGALARSAAKFFLTPGCDAQTASDYFARAFPAVHIKWTKWLQGHGGSSGRAGTFAPEAYVPLPIHPANVAHVKADFASLLTENLLLLPRDGDAQADDVVVVMGAPLMSCRTLLPLHDGGGSGGGGRAPASIKLPVPVQMTSLLRYLSPVEINGGPLISSMLQEVISRDEALRQRLLVLPEECAIHVDHPSVSYERARYLSAMYRASISVTAWPGAADGSLPGGARVLPLAALLSQDPISRRPVLHHILEAFAAAASSSSRPTKGFEGGSDERGSEAGGAASATSALSAAALEWYSSYVDVALDGALRLWCCYGVTLELHQQNTQLVLGASGRLLSLVCREVAGGGYCWEPLLLANGFDLRPQLHARQDAVFAEARLPRSILLHALFCQHLLPLADAVASLVPGIERPRLIRHLRASIEATLRRCAVEHEPRLTSGAAAFHQNLSATEHALLTAPTVRAKSLLHMRALGTKAEMFAEASNPLLATSAPPRQQQQQRSGGHKTPNEEKGSSISSSDGTTKASGSRTLGRLEMFPLSWRGVHEVAGGSQAWERLDAAMNAARACDD
jgi:siderophore synthetase component